ncbi:MAG TPA: hypothetical protein DGH68_05775, partial [Bacteroidetes bacterium]|nr:hypothetical protein [Bacteroidota bacterium]
MSESDTTKAVWLGGFHLWSNVQDGANTYPPPVVNMRKYWDSLSANRNNFVRLWSGWEQAAGLIETSDNWYWEPLPFRRTGPGIAHDGRLKFNLDSLNQAFFDRVYRHCDSLRLRGIYVAVQLFDGWSNGYPNHGLSSGNPWYHHPYNVANNVNGVNGDPNGNGSGEEVHYSPYGGGSGVQAVWDRQWKYVRKLIDDLNPLDNILWEICNEAEGFGETVAWQNLIADSIHAYEARKPKKHLVWFTSGEYPNDSLWHGRSECVAPGAFGLDGNIWMTSPPDSNGRKVVIVDTDHIWGMVNDNQVPWIWKNFCNGNSVTLQDNFCSEPSYPYWDCDNVNWPPFRRAMGVAIGLANTADLLHMTPQPNKSSTSDYVLFGAATGEVIVYQASGNIIVNLA